MLESILILDFLFWVYYFLFLVLFNPVFGSLDMKIRKSMILFQMVYNAAFDLVKRIKISFNPVLLLTSDFSVASS